MKSPLTDLPVSFNPKLFIFYLTFILLTGCQQDKSNIDALSKDENVFYEIYVPHWGDQNAIESIESRITHMQNLFVNGVILSPMHEISDRMKFGQIGSPFAVKDFEAFNTELGTEDQFIDLIDSLHSSEMIVIMDWFPAIAAYDNPLAKNPDTSDLKRVFENIDNFSFADATRLDYKDPEVLNGMIKAMKHWMSKYNLDGFRIHQANHLPENLLDEMQDLETIMIAGIESDKADFKFTFQVDTDFYEAMVEASKSESPDPIKKMLENKKDMTRSIHFTSNYIKESQNGSVAAVFGNRYKLAFVLANFLDGHLMLRGGQEISMQRGTSLYLNRDIIWPEKTEMDFYRELILLKNRNKALQPRSDIQTSYINTNNEHVLGIEKKYKGHTVIGIFNFSGQSENVIFDDPIFNVDDYQRRRPIQIRAGEEVKLAPMQYLLFTNV